MAVVEYEKKGKIAYVTMNRPEKLNAMNPEMRKQLALAWMRVRDDRDVWAAIVTGAGDRAFSAGADVGGGGTGAETEAEEQPVWNAPLRSVWDIDLMLGGLEVWKPMIAAIRGYCLGGGFQIALACDIRIAAEDAQFGSPEVLLGILPMGGLAGIILRRAPFGVATELLMTGERIGAQDALRLGLVNKVVPAADLMPAAEAMANKLVRNSPAVLRRIKMLLHSVPSMGMTEQLRLEEAYTRETREDLREGMRAYVEKREPVWKDPE